MPDSLLSTCQKLAAEGYSRTHAAEALGIERRKFYIVCKGLDVQWPCKGASLRDASGHVQRSACIRAQHRKIRNV